MLRASSSTSRAVLPTQVLVRARQALKHLLLFDGKIRHHSMQKQRCLVEQPFRRFDAFHHDAPRHGVELCIFLGGKFAAGEDHNRHIAQMTVCFKLLENLKSRHVGEFEVKHHAIARFHAKNSQCVRSRLRGDDFNVAVTEQLADAEPFSRIVFDDRASASASARSNP